MLSVLLTTEPLSHFTGPRVETLSWAGYILSLNTIHTPGLTHLLPYAPLEESLGSGPCTMAPDIEKKSVQKNIIGYMVEGSYMAMHGSMLLLSLSHRSE